MFLDKINEHANRISLNFLGFSGWVVFVVFCCLFGVIFYISCVLNKPFPGMVGVLYIGILLVIAFLPVFIAPIIWLLENYFGWRIKNNFFLNNGFMKFLRYFGLVCIALIWFVFVIYIIGDLLLLIFFGAPEYS